MPTKRSSSKPSKQKTSRAKSSPSPKVKKRSLRGNLRTSARKKTMVRAEGIYCFWVNNGPVLSSLEDLHAALKESMSDAQFNYHTREGENDFAVWVKNILKDKKCAEALKGVSTRKAAASIVGKYLLVYR